MAAACLDLTYLGRTDSDRTFLLEEIIASWVMVCLAEKGLEDCKVKIEAPKATLGMAKSVEEEERMVGIVKS